MLQTCLSLVSLTHTCAVQGEGGRAVVLCGEQRGWRGRRKGVGFPLPWQQLQTHTIHSGYERLCAAVTRTLTRRQLRERSHISPPNPHTPSLSSSRKVWSCNEKFQVCALFTHLKHPTITTAMLNEIYYCLSNILRSVSAENTTTAYAFYNWSVTDLIQETAQIWSETWSWISEIHSQDGAHVRPKTRDRPTLQPICPFCDYSHQ